MGLYSDDEDENLEIKASETFSFNATPKQVKETLVKEKQSLEKTIEERKKKLPAFLHHVGKVERRKVNTQASKEDFLKSMMTVKDRHSSGQKESERQESQRYALNSVIDLNNQPKVKRPKLVTVTANDGSEYVAYDPRHPNEYDRVAARLNRINTKNFGELAKQRAKQVMEKLNQDQPKKKPPPGLDYSSSDDDDHRTGRGGGAQIAPPSFLSEAGPEKSGTTPKVPVFQKKKAAAVVPLFQRAKQSGIEKRFNPKRETTVVVVKNVVGPGEVDADLKGEVVEECSKYGRILDSKIIDLSVEKDDVDPTEAVRIFLKYQDVSQSKFAVETLNGRFFAGRTLGCEFFDVARFDKDELWQQ